MDFHEKIAEKFEDALNSGSLLTYETDERLVKDEIDFIVFVLKKLSARDKKFWKKGSKPDVPGDPFLPYENELFVGDLTKTHICLLNKYNVIKNHILIVTRAFEDQETPLTEPDFEALFICMEKFNGLAFYNSGRIAGASQRHKHMQLIKLPLTGCMEGIPIFPLISTLDRSAGGILKIPRFEFSHGICFLQENASPGYLFSKYMGLLEFTGLQPGPSGGWGPYNLLLTREWMLLIPRVLESYKGISVNSLGFAGTLLVKDLHEFARIKRAGLLKILNCVARHGS
ncbi:MAG: phosphorylase [Brevinematales bacterium]|jgi:ATP adenylyltransferase